MQSHTCFWRRRVFAERGVVLLAAVVALAAVPAAAQPELAGPPAAPDSVAQAADSAYSELLERIEALEQAQGERELEDLRRIAETEAAAAQAAAPAPAAEAVFTSGSRALQALNPELSITADAGLQLAMSGAQPDTLGDGSGMIFRAVGLHFEANLDPYSFLKIAVPVKLDGVELEEAYATWVGLLPDLSLTVGRFRQQFGVVNRWHTPALDQWDFPLALTTLLGDDGLCQLGFGLEWRMPALLASSHTLTLQVTNPMNDHLFEGSMVGVPTALAHLRNYWDLTSSTYLELGLSGMWGVNHRPEHLPEDDPLFVAGANDWRDTWVGGLDLTVSWAPLRFERYRGLTWRSELFAVRKEIPGDRIQALGAYSYLDARLSQTWVIGVRGDVTQPFEADNGGKLDWAVSPYVTWWQSAWVKLRLQGTHLRRDGGQIDNRLVLQAVMSVGPHKHAQY